MEIGRTRNCLEQKTLGQVTFVITVEDEGQILAEKKLGRPRERGPFP